MNKRPAGEKHIPAPVSDPAPSLLRSLWLSTCARFTVLCLLLLLISAIMADSLTTTYVDTVRFFLLLPFGFCLTVAARVRRSDKLSVGAKCGLHPLASLGGFYLCCYLPYQISTKPSGSQVLIVLLFVAILYGIGMGIYALVTRSSRHKKLEDSPYVSQFGTK